MTGRHEGGFWRKAFPHRRIRVCLHCDTITEEQRGEAIVKSGKLKGLEAENDPLGFASLKPEGGIEDDWESRHPE